MPTYGRHGPQRRRSYIAPQTRLRRPAARLPALQRSSMSDLDIGASCVDACVTLNGIILRPRSAKPPKQAPSGHFYATGIINRAPVRGPAAPHGRRPRPRAAPAPRPRPSIERRPVREERRRTGGSEVPTGSRRDRQSGATAAFGPRTVRIEHQAAPGSPPRGPGSPPRPRPGAAPANRWQPLHVDRDRGDRCQSGARFVKNAGEPGRSQVPPAAAATGRAAPRPRSTAPGAHHK